MNEEMGYYLSIGRKGCYESERVHREDCAVNGLVVEKIFLGQFKQIKDALAMAQRDFPKAELCLQCYWNDSQ